ncbi:TadE-like protein [Micromonospora sp. Llam0]|uniref:TadE/TadG family type IV pilus assembly protein n=1 Tax=Micromonospora sp. Llam0 TaxID=2485143 RepID=UPI000F4967A5|nr:TadE/TadG family type IV pilus assembly protein [Micromonospora sp. Llam0]ROO52813.1 TadE-like protein [Micromonospora sp. Llam0]
MAATHPPRRRPGGDRGSTTTEVVLYAPLLMLLVLLGVQFATWGLAQLAVQHAAHHALQTTRVQGGTVAAGQADADAVLTHIAGSLVSGRQISVTRTTDTATVHIRADAPRVVPFLTLRVSTTVVAPVERFRPDTDLLGLAGQAGDR